MLKTTSDGNAAFDSGKFISINSKITLLILLLFLTFLVGMGVLIFNSFRMQQTSHDLTGRYEDAMANNYFSRFDDFLNAIEASSGISQNLGEVFYALRNTLSRQELARTMEKEYHTAFARETALLGGGAFFEPRAFYPDVHDFHCFVSKELTAAGIASEQNVRWVGDTWKWDVDTYEESWYQVALPKDWNRALPREKRYYWSELYVDASVDALMVTVSIPIYSFEKRIVGVSTVDVSLSTLQKAVSSFPLPTPSAQIAGFSTANNATFAVSGSEKFDIVSYPKDGWLSRLSELKPGQTVNSSITMNGKSYTLTASVHESGIGLAILTPDAEKYAAVDALQNRNFITGVTIVILMIAIIIIEVFALSRWIVKPIRRTFTALETFAKGDLTQNINTNGNDELAQMIRMISRTQEGIKHIIKAISEKAHILSENSRNLSFVASQLARSADDTVEKSNKAVSATEQMVVNIRSMANDAEQASRNADKVAGTADEMSVNMNTMVTAIEEMSASINRIAGNTTDVRLVATEAADKAKDATNAMNKLGEAAKEIGHVTEVIKKIADKTNLLALNATIEAASAGEAGKGFAVVAGEIKELANQSAQSADDIARRIEGIQSGTDNAIGVIHNVSDIIVNINRSVEDIAGHVEQQTKASNEISRNVTQANTGAKRAAGAIGDVASGANSVSRNAGEAAKGAADVSGNITSMSHAARESAQGAAMVNQSASSLSEIAEELNKAIAQFKV